MDAASLARPVMSVAEAHALLTAAGSPFEVEEVQVRGVATRVWKNIPATLRDVLEASRQFGERDFLVYQDERISFDAFYKAVASLANVLRDAGVEPGDRVAIAMRNLPEWPVAFYAASCLGALATPLNAWWATPELEYALADSGARIAFMDVERFDSMPLHLPNCPDLETVVVARMPDEVDLPYVTRMEDLIGPTSAWRDLPEIPLPDVEMAADDDTALFYTSGTTGRAGGVLLSHRNINSHLMVAGSIAARDAIRYDQPLPVHETPEQAFSILVSIPFFHVTGSFAMLNPALLNGRKLVLMRRWDPVKAMELIERERISVCGGVPTTACQMVDHPDRANYDLSSLLAVSYGGAPPPPDLVGKIAATWPAATTGNGWGMTETAAAVIQHSGIDYLTRPDSCGPPLAVSDVKIMSLEGDRELPVGEVGELWCRGPQIGHGYWNRPDLTAEVFRDGWVRTGDLARMDEEGFCFIVDRLKDMLIRGGENIYCIEVEDALQRHPEVAEAALIGLPHPCLGEEPAAVVTLEPGATISEAALQSFVATQLAAFKIPVKIVMTNAPLPRTANGKMRKTMLRAWLEHPESAATLPADLR